MKNTVSLLISKELLEKLKERAAAECRSVSSMIRLFIMQGLTNG
ncbi:ribbon-helix-helix domain-containing protein [Caldithrix abyssi]